MKKLFLGAVMAFGMLTASAQTKLGYINTTEVIRVMPEAAKVQADVNEYENTLKQQGDVLEQEFYKKRDQYFKDSATFSNSKKEIVSGELNTLLSRLQTYDQEVQQKTAQYGQDKFGPVQQKLIDAVNAVAKEKGYTYVFDDAQGALLVMPPGDNLLAAVKAKLGIKDPPPAPAGK